MNNLNLVIICILFSCLNYICLKYNFLIDKVETSNHKKFISKNSSVPITGGLFLFTGYAFSNHFIFNFVELYFFLIILIIGYISDLNKNFNPSLRLLSQAVICFVFLIYFNLDISNIRIDTFNYLLEFKLISFIFTLFCILVLINGSNFIDGVNLLSNGYFLLITLSLIYLTNNYDLRINLELIDLLKTLLIIILLFNIFNKTFLGDGGIYFLSFLISIILIRFNNENISVSPYYIISILWYPCFENLFSIIRKKINQKNPQKPDNMHLHHLLYASLNSVKSKVLRSNVCGSVILLFNLPIFFLSTLYYNHTKLLLVVIFFSVASYIFFYNHLKKKFEIND